MTSARTKQSALEPDPAPDPNKVATGPDTIAALVAKSGRTGEHTPIRRSFVQPLDKAERPLGGPLAQLVRHRDERALVLYLLALTMASKDPWDVKRHSKIWARALDLGSTSSSREAVSKAWRRLRDLKLIEAGRSRRLAVVTMLREDGSGEPYEYPEPDRVEDRYLRLPFAFWVEGWYHELHLPGLAMLLVLLAEKDDVVLPIDRVPSWYGISRATAQRGLAELREAGLVEMRVEQRVEPLAPEGFTFERHHRLVGSFARPAQSTATVTPLTPVTPLTLSAASRRRQRRKAAAGKSTGPATTAAGAK
jgi:DNA-binding transcriptional ArsR family regulator